MVYKVCSILQITQFGFSIKSYFGVIYHWGCSACPLVNRVKLTSILQFGSRLNRIKSQGKFTILSSTNFRGKVNRSSFVLSPAKATIFPVAVSESTTRPISLRISNEATCIRCISVSLNGRNHPVT